MPPDDSLCVRFWVRLARMTIRSSRSGNGKRPRWSLRNILLCLGFALVVGSGVILPAFLFVSIKSIPPNSDFITFYSAASLIREGRAADAYLPSAMDSAATAIAGRPIDGLRWLYPPGMLLAVSPFGSLTLADAYLLWLALGWGLLTLSLWRLAPHPAMALLVLLCPAVVYCAIVGEVSLFATASAAAGFATLNRRPGLAGAFFGLVTLKIQLALILPVCLLAGRHYRSLLAMFVTATVLEAAGIALAGMHSLPAFLATSHEILGVVAHRPELLPRLPTVYSLLVGLSLAPAVAIVCQAIVSLADIVAVFVIWRRSNDLAVRTLAWAAGAVLATPFIYDYDLVIFVVPLAAIAKSRWKQGIAWSDAIVMSILWWGSFGVRYLAGAAGFQAGPLLVALLLVYAVWNAGIRGNDERSPAANGSSMA